MYVVSERDVPTDRPVFYCHGPDLLVAIRIKLPDSRYFYLSKLKRSFPYLWPPSARAIIRKISHYQFDGVSLKERRFLSIGYVEQFQSVGLLVFVWTINEHNALRRYVDIGVDGVITDRVLSFSQNPNASTLQGSFCNPG